MWVTGVPLTYTVLAHFNKAYVQNERHRDKVARAAKIKDAKADAKSESKKRSGKEMEQNEENQDNRKKKRRRSGDRSRAPHTNQEHSPAPTRRGNAQIMKERSRPPPPKQRRPRPVNAQRHLQACRRQGQPTIPEGIRDY